MRLRNNNRQIIRFLALQSSRYHRERNRLMMGIIAIMVLLVFYTASMPEVRIRTEQVSDWRSSGYIFNSAICQPDAEQVTAIDAWEEVRSTGIVYEKAEGILEDRGRVLLVATDEEVFEEMYKPAYSDVTGEFPGSEQEVMLPLYVLDLLGITRPEPGMEIELKIATENGTEVHSFILSGFYTDYVSAYRRAHMMFQGMPENTGHMESGKILLLRLKDSVSGLAFHDRLEQVRYGEEQFSGEGGLTYTDLKSLQRDTRIVWLMIASACLVMGLFSWYILSYSLVLTRKQLVILEVLGATGRQNARILLRQGMPVLAGGLAAGAVLSLGSWFVAAPWLIGKYLTVNYRLTGPMVMVPLRTEYLFLALIIAASIAEAEMLYIAYIGAREQKRSGKRRWIWRTGKRGVGTMGLAVRNILQHPGTAAMMLLVLFLAVVMQLTAFVISHSQDMKADLQQRDDFIFASDEWGDTAAGQLWINEDMLEEIQAVEGVTDMEVTRGGYGMINLLEPVWSPVLENRSYGETRAEPGITILTESQMDQLEIYAAEYECKLDMNGLRNGTAVIAGHLNDVTAEQEAAAEQLIGDSVTIAGETEREGGTLNFGGYINLSRKGMRSMIGGVYSAGTPHLLMSEAAYEKIRMVQRNHRVTYQAEEGYEPYVRQQAEEMAARWNAAYDEGGGISLWIKSRELEENDRRIRVRGIVWYGISLSLMLMGSAGYVHMVAAGRMNRRRELAILESAGMTGRQQMQMILAEGLLYATMISGLVFTAGNLLVQGAFRMLKVREPSAGYHYPTGMVVLLFIGIYALCTLVPFFVYNRKRQDSVAIQLKKQRKV